MAGLPFSAPVLQLGDFRKIVASSSSSRIEGSNHWMNVRPRIFGLWTAGVLVSSIRRYVYIRLSCQRHCCTVCVSSVYSEQKYDHGELGPNFAVHPDSGHLIL